MSSKPRILIATVDVLGWRTYATRLREYAAQREDFVPMFLSLRPSLVDRICMSRVPFTSTKFVDPLNLFRWKVERWWRDEGRQLQVDAIHVATQTCALGFSEIHPRKPFSIALDVTRRLATKEFSGQTFSARSLGWEQSIFDRAYAIAAFSDWTTASLFDDYKISPDKIFRCLPSLAMPPLLNRRQELSGRDTALPNILFVGNDYVRKGGDRLVEWHQKYFVDRAQLHIVSSQAPLTRRLRNVVWYGRVDNHRLMSIIYPQMAIFCLPTRADMSSWVIAEANASQVPSVTSRVGGIGEVCLHEKTGFVIAPENEQGFIDAIDQLLVHQTLRLEMGIQARRYAEECLNSSITYKTLFDRILSGI